VLSPRLALWWVERVRRPPVSLFVTFKIRKHVMRKILKYLFVLAAISQFDTSYANNMFFVQLKNENLRFIQLNLISKKIRVIHKQTKSLSTFTINGNNSQIFINKSNENKIESYLVKTSDGRISPLPIEKEAFDSKFFDENLLVYSYSEGESEKKYKTVFFDTKSMEQKKIMDGYKYVESLTGNSIYYLERNWITLVKDSVSINRIRNNNSTELLKIELGEWIYDITDLVALNDKDFIFRIYDEHEYRYYKNDLKNPFFPGKNKSHTEQYGLVISKNGKFACFRERNWNELSRIIIIDIENNKRIDTNFIGAFQTFKDNKLYFISDPNLLITEDLTFQKFSKYSLYELDLNTMKQEKIFDFDRYTQSF